MLCRLIATANGSPVRTPVESTSQQHIEAVGLCSVPLRHVMYTAIPSGMLCRLQEPHAQSRCACLAHGHLIPIVVKIPLTINERCFPACSAVWPLRLSSWCNVLSVQRPASAYRNGQRHNVSFRDKRPQAQEREHTKEELHTRI